jgi:hypothetical protein
MGIADGGVLQALELCDFCSSMRDTETGEACAHLHETFVGREWKVCDSARPKPMPVGLRMGSSTSLVERGSLRAFIGGCGTRKEFDSMRLKPLQVG